MGKSAILEHKREGDILNPRPITLTLSTGETFDVFPMPDGTLIHVGDALSQVTGVIDAFVDLMKETEEAGAELAPRDYLGLVPQLIRALLPCASQLIAGCLRLPAEQVATSMRLADKLEALRVILEAEDIPLILGNFAALSAILRPAPAAAPSTE